MSQSEREQSERVEKTFSKVDEILNSLRDDIAAFVVEGKFGKATVEINFKAGDVTTSSTVWETTKKFETVR